MMLAMEPVGGIASLKFSTPQVPISAVPRTRFAAPDAPVSLAQFGEGPQWLKRDPLLAKPKYVEAITNRWMRAEALESRLTQHGRLTLDEFAAGHQYYGLHFDNVTNEWVFREKAPNATEIFLVHGGTDWKPRDDHRLERIDANTFELRLPKAGLKHQDEYRLQVRWSGGEGERIPTYARRVVQNPGTKSYNAQVWAPPERFVFKHARPKIDTPIIYEAHVGMAQEDARVGTYREFIDNVLPRVAAGGYNTIQLMAVAEHPYYASFGYHVANYFAPSARCGTPDELKELIDAAHAMGIAVVFDLVHSHTAVNEVEGIGNTDGSGSLYTREGRHPAWDSYRFDYGKDDTLHLLLSNVRYWLEEFNVDGYRFDGVGSMLYKHHGLGHVFGDYEKYFDDQVDEDALDYLSLAMRLQQRVAPGTIAIPEDISGMPGLAAPLSEGGVGFTHRPNMGVADMWTRLARDIRDEDWSVDDIWYELTRGRPEEKRFPYVECHDQALVGDQTLIFRLAGADMYEHMAIGRTNHRVERALALTKMIRLMTQASARDGYMDFMGNEWGHPEWIDFPRKGNKWSFEHARRQWSLVDNPFLHYKHLDQFNGRVLNLLRSEGLFAHKPMRLMSHVDDQVLAFSRGDLVFIFNFNPHASFDNYGIPTEAGIYQEVMHSADKRFGGPTERPDPPVRRRTDDKGRLSVNLPSRSALVLRRIP